MKHERLENAVIEAQFFNGTETFRTNFAKDRIIQMILRNGKRLIYQASTEAIITHFL